MTEPISIDLFLHKAALNSWMVSVDGNPERAVWLPKILATIDGDPGNKVTVTGPSWMFFMRGLL